MTSDDTQTPIVKKIGPRTWRTYRERGPLFAFTDYHNGTVLLSRYGPASATSVDIAIKSDELAALLEAAGWMCQPPHTQQKANEDEVQHA